MLLLSSTLALAQSPPAVQAALRAALGDARPAAAVVMEPESGQILVAVGLGGASPWERHQVGTSIKPLVLLAALQSGTLTLETEMPRGGWWPASPSPPPKTWADELARSTSTTSLHLALAAPQELDHVWALLSFEPADLVTVGTGQVSLSLVALTRAYAELARSAAGAGRLDSASACQVLGWLPEREGLRCKVGSAGFAAGATHDRAVGVWTEDPALARQAFEAVTRALAASQPLRPWVPCEEPQR